MVRPAHRSRALHLLPEKLEVFHGKLLYEDEDRIKMLGLLLEQVGADQALRLGDPKVWIAACAALASRPPVAGPDAP